MKLIFPKNFQFTLLCNHFSLMLSHVSRISLLRNLRVPAAVFFCFINKQLTVSPHDSCIFFGLTESNLGLRLNDPRWQHVIHKTLPSWFIYTQNPSYFGRKKMYCQYRECGVTDNSISDLKIRTLFRSIPRRSHLLC